MQQPVIVPGVLALLQQADRLRQAGRLADSLPHLQQAARLCPAHAELQHDVALTHLMVGQIEAALPYLLRALAVNPGHGAARLNYGKALEKLGRPGFAQAYREAALLLPNSAEAQARLASTLEQMGERAEALVLYRRAASLLPRGTRDQLMYTARAAFIADDLDEAEAASRALLALDGRNATARGMLARVLSAQGDFAAAAAELEQALADKPGEVSFYYNLVGTRRLTDADAPLIERMRQAEAMPAPALARIRLQHALAKGLDDLGQHEEAAAALRQAGALRATHYPMDRETLRLSVDGMLALCTKARVAQAARDGHASELPVLVLGLPRSGTTLTERILARHSQVAGAGELGFWDNAAPALLQAKAPPQETAEAGARYVAWLRERHAHATRVVDKNPFNTRWALLVHLALPNARIIYCRRHAADTALSIMMAALRPQPWFGTSADELLFCMRQYHRLMAHARDMLPPSRFYELSYERLVTEPATEIQALLAFCGLADEAACHSPEQDGRAILTASVWQARQAINAGSVGRWRRYAAMLAEFIALEAEEGWVDRAGPPKPPVAS